MEALGAANHIDIVLVLGAQRHHPLGKGGGTES